MSAKPGKSLAVRVSLAAGTDLHEVVKVAPNRAARLSELATIGLALQQMQEIAPSIRPQEPVTKALPPSNSLSDVPTRTKLVDEAMLQDWTS